MSEASERLRAPGMDAPGRAPAAVDRDRAIAVARVIVRAPNIDADSEIGLLARAFLREAGLS